MMCAFIEPEAWGVGLCRMFIENGATLYFKDKYGLNAFQYAVIYDRIELVKVYLKAIDFKLDDSDKLGNTALHYAVRAGNANVVRLVAQAFVRYNIRFDKENNDGFTALREAHRLNKRRCARILENTEALADVSHIEANIPLDLSALDTGDDQQSVRSMRRPPLRPRSSVLSHKSSKTSLLSGTEYSFRRSTTIYSFDMKPRTRIRDRKQPENVPPHEKNVHQLIRCASASDIRNNPEYLFQLSPGEGSCNGDLRTATPKRHQRAKSAYVRRSEFETDHHHPRHATWRTELRQLYTHYQFQCTPSYRESVVTDTMDNASLPPLDKPITPATSEHAIDDMDKGRKSRAKSARQNMDECSSAGKNRKNARKSSQSSSHGKGAEPSLESSSESINSSVSSKRQADAKSKSGKDPAGRQSRNAIHKGAAAGEDRTQDSLRVISE